MKCLPSTQHRAPTPFRQAIRALTSALGGLTTAIRAVAMTFPVHSPRVAEPLDWVRDGLEEYDRLAKEDSEATLGNHHDPLARQAVCLLTQAGEDIASALERLVVDGSALSSVEALRPVLYADAHLTELLRLAPEGEHRAAIREIWGREAVAVRLQ